MQTKGAAEMFQVFVIVGAVISAINAMHFYSALSSFDQALSDKRLYDFDQGTLNLRNRSPQSK